jgi:hypothetical protein
LLCNGYTIRMTFDRIQGSILFVFFNEKEKEVFLHIVMKVALFSGKIVVKVVFFFIILFHLLGDDCQSIPIFFVIFHKYF